jgi:hypothetical protein
MILIHMSIFLAQYDYVSYRHSATQAMTFEETILFQDIPFFFVDRVSTAALMLILLVKCLFKNGLCMCKHH